MSNRLFFLRPVPSCQAQSLPAQTRVPRHTPRATPNERLIPWLLEELSQKVRRPNITLINSIGTHRPNTREELERMLTADVMDNYRVVNHEPENPDSLVQVGVTRTGQPALINKQVVEADVRIATGFIEPHFFAGFSGGPKGIMPGVAGLKTVMQNHSGANLGSPNATFSAKIKGGTPVSREPKFRILNRRFRRSHRFNERDTRSLSPSFLFRVNFCSVQRQPP
jgi:nickel-dependent lactate racemase